MVNLWTGTVKTHGVYQNVEELSGITFTSGNTYEIQVVGKAYLREGTIGKGILVDSSKLVEFNPSDETLYICTHYPECEVNISD